jgi:RimJ/RimL family protein N-acetyltransferase
MREVFETERLRLRLLAMSDAAAVARLAGDPDVARMILRAPLPYLEVAAEGWIMTLKARAPLGEDFVRAVEREGEGLVGVIGAHARGDGGFEVGYWFGRPYWGRGYATEALNSFLADARGLGALEAGHFVDNPASGRVLEKNGFVYTGDTEWLFSLGRGARAQCRRMRYRGDRMRAGAGETAAVN